MVGKRRLEVVIGFLVVLAMMSSQCDAQCVSGSSVTQWRCWEQTIVGSVDFYRSGAGNPYRDLTLRVTFTAGATSFTQDAFWLSDTTNPRSFKVRAALPPGNWTWQVAGCTGTTGGLSCATGVTWSPASGTIAVSVNTAGAQLYARGFPTQNCTWSKSLPPTLIGCSSLVYGDKVTPFFWVGDTAWSAPAVEIRAQLQSGTQYWSQYLATRTPSGLGPPANYHFTTILIAPADYYNQANAPDVFSVQSPCQLMPGETNTFPNNCSIPQAAYWNAFDNLVYQANQQDLFLLIAGLMHPFDTHPYSSYPSLASTARFSRYLAARMAGFAAMFSPGFDLPVSGTAVDGSTLRSVMDASGSAVKAASPRALITNHLNGQATCTDYESFAMETPSPLPWMTSYLFQSGHAGNMNGVTGTICPGYLSTDPSPVAAAMRRAITMPPTLAAAAPSLPAINGEGPYDDPANDPSAYSQVNMQYRVRQAANLTPLSNAQGFTYGVTQLGTWTTPSSYWSLSSASDMSRFADRFMPRSGLQSHPEWIVNNPAAYDQQQAVASNGSNIVVAYVPPVNPASLPPSLSITLDTTKPGFPSGIGCPGSGSSWTIVWEAPTTNSTAPPSSCSQASGRIILTSPLCTDQKATSECDWILLMSKTGNALINPAQSTTQSPLSIPRKLAVWRDLSTGDGTSALLARFEGSDEMPPIQLSPGGISFQDGARVVNLSDGYVVVWHADRLDDSLLGVFGQKLDTNGNLAGPMFRINSTTLNDQRDPEIAADLAGNVVVVWSSYGQDGEFGGIYGQLFDAKGKTVGGEFQVNNVTSGHQTEPRVAYLPNGMFVVGWTTEAMYDDLGAISFRVFSGNGTPLLKEVRIAGNVAFHPMLVDLEPGSSAGFGLRWALRNNSRATIASYHQRFTTQGVADGAAEVLP
jgi:hypothetical protein